MSIVQEGKKVAMCSDHAGYELKAIIEGYLDSQDIAYVDFGTHSEESCDYPDYAKPAARAVADGTCEKGIVICTTGIGVSICANKIDGVRCALCSDPVTAKLTRLHNDTNVVAIGAGIVGELLAMDIIDIFLTTEFSNDPRHIRRVEKMVD